MTKILNNSRYEGISCPIYSMGHAYAVPASAVLQIIDAPDRTIQDVYDALGDKPQYAPFLMKAVFYGQQTPMITPEGVLLLANEWDNDAAYRLHAWLRRAAHKLASRATSTD